jgi:hypothetical protein
MGVDVASGEGSIRPIRAGSLMAGRKNARRRTVGGRPDGRGRGHSTPPPHPGPPALTLFSGPSGRAVLEPSASVRRPAQICVLFGDRPALADAWVRDRLDAEVTRLPIARTSSSSASDWNPFHVVQPPSGPSPLLCRPPGLPHRLRPRPRSRPHHSLPPSPPAQGMQL